MVEMPPAWFTAVEQHAKSTSISGAALSTQIDLVLLVLSRSLAACQTSQAAKARHTSMPKLVVMKFVIQISLPKSKTLILAVLLYHRHRWGGTCKTYLLIFPSSG
ncbi:hypothetical protein M378DRAFT_759198 [Amanita muscaria Koide BX008]|uniref:Uncharacterized protein n=1 Tax=Amanita muscaria (strain Koide BX008) TaxID=946122 RepID=A0A0C2W0D9_AMAMK|nr:hypothetical protein M378DRAFT_759198 [Amanita muscaria Koide BX008]